MPAAGNPAPITEICTAPELHDPAELTEAMVGGAAPNTHVLMVIPVPHVLVLEYVVEDVGVIGEQLSPSDVFA